MAIRTIFSTVEDCSRGAYDGWYELVRDYAPVARTLLSHYFPALQPDIDAAVDGAFAGARANDNAWFRSLQFANEREFAMAFRDLVFSFGRSVARLPAPRVAPDEIFALLEGLTLIRRQFFWEFLKGWDVQQSSAILMNASATAGETRKITDERLSRFGPATERSAVALIALEAAQSRRGAECLALRTFNNLVNGQISWNDREAADRHVTDCVHCLDAFTAFQEMIWLLKHRVTLADADAQMMVSRMGVRGSASKRFMGRLFSRAS